MIYLLVDTCVWIDAAKDPEQTQLLGVLEDLIEMGELRIIVPRLLLDEFSRNKQRIIQDSARSLSATFKRVKEAVRTFGNDEETQATLATLNNVDHRIPQFGENVNQAIARIEKILVAGCIVEIEDAVKVRAAQRAIEKTAPFHRQRNSIGDAILIEVYSDIVRNSNAGDRFAFVTHNHQDFSDPNGDRKRPHPDLSGLFTKIKSRYCTSLAEAVHRVKPELVAELMFEHEEWFDPPRSISELTNAIGWLTDLVWYNRHKVLEERVANGELSLVEKEEFPIKDPMNRPMQRDIWQRAQQAAKRMEEKHGLEKLGPWTDFEWGMINGKLSALRWALGDEWDMLDT